MISINFFPLEILDICNGDNFKDMTTTAQLIEDLSTLTKAHIDQVKKFQQLSDEELNKKPAKDAWSILECIEHLNFYGDFYLPEIRSRMEKSHFKAVSRFKPGLLGNYFAKAMLPKEKLNKMKTFRSMNPIGSKLDSSVLDCFIKQQHEMLTLLEKAKNKNLNRIKTSISISKWIKLKLGDTLRVVIYHNKRHIVQAQNILNHPTI